MSRKREQLSNAMDEFLSTITDEDSEMDSEEQTLLKIIQGYTFNKKCKKENSSIVAPPGVIMINLPSQEPTSISSEAKTLLECTQLLIDSKNSVLNLIESSKQSYSAMSPAQLKYMVHLSTSMQNLNKIVQNESERLWKKSSEDK